MTDQQKAKRLGRLRRGREFHRLIQDEWHNNAEGQITSEKGCKKPSGRRGFMDIYVGAANSDPKLTAVVEVKCSDWDRMTPQAVKRNVRRQIKQTQVPDSECEEDIIHLSAISQGPYRVACLSQVAEGSRRPAMPEP